ncbi:MAG: taurine dioxygenase [Rhodospirillaceae bacterium]|nr:taurine dioxygenase [Rhodospirillaceae bacterium]
MKVTPLSSAIGAEISGVDISTELTNSVIKEIRAALLNHLVVFFRNQDLTDAERHRSFTRRFGDLFVHPNFNLGQENPEMVYLTRMPGDTAAAGQRWHADTTMMKNPPMGAILYALEVPSWGGDTLFANQYMAYENLSTGMKKLLNNLKAVHNDSRVAGPKVGLNSKRATKVREDENWEMTENVHPVVRTHPETGKKCLFINCIYVHHFEGMTVEESSDLLDFLYTESTRPEYTCRFRWQTGSVAFWDNRCVQHLAIHDNHEAIRKMQRTQIVGEKVK